VTSGRGIAGPSSNRRDQGNGIHRQDRRATKCNYPNQKCRGQRHMRIAYGDFRRSAFCALSRKACLLPEFHSGASKPLLGAHRFRILTMVAQFTRGCLALLVNGSLTGTTMAWALSKIIAEPGVPLAPRHYGTEFRGKATYV
jgi:hypothetical protein